MSNNEPTNKEILNEVAGIKEVVTGVKENTEQILEAIGIFSNKTEERFSKVEGEIAVIKANMVTRDHLDEKLSDLKGDMSIIIRKEDRKLGELVKVLEEKKIITPEDVKRVLSLEPFPHK